MVSCDNTLLRRVLTLSVLCFLENQKNSRRLWRSRRRKSSSVPEGTANFPAAVFLAGKCPNLGRDSISCCRKIGEESSSSVEICRKPFQQGISDSHSLLEFSEKMARKTIKKTRILYPHRTPKIPGRAKRSKISRKSSQGKKARNSKNARKGSFVGRVLRRDLVVEFSRTRGSERGS